MCRRERKRQDLVILHIINISSRHSFVYIAGQPSQERGADAVPAIPGQTRYKVMASS